MGVKKGLSLDFDNLLFYDMEVFKHNYIIVFSDINKNIKGIYLDTSPNLLGDLQDIIDNYTLVGYNNYGYDDNILDSIVNGKYKTWMVKNLNNKIIGGERMYNYSINSLDCMQEVAVGGLGLKEIQANKGDSIVESEIDFDIDRPLTEEELESSINYCISDVFSTVDVFKDRLNNYFKPKFSIVSQYEHIKGVHMRKTVPTIAGLIFGSEWKLHEKIVGDDVLQLLDTRIQHYFKEILGTKYTLDMFGNIIELAGSGGVHGENPLLSNKLLYNVFCYDFSSLHPSNAIKYKIFQDKTDIYEAVKDERFAIKEQMKSVTDELLYSELDQEQEGKKLLINKTFGATGNKYNKLYDVNKMDSICYTGQVATLYLTEYLHKLGLDIIQINTDGVMTTEHNLSHDEIQNHILTKVGIPITSEKYDIFFQKAVNQYCAVQDGKVKVKGTYFAKYNDRPYQNNSCRIVDIMVVNKILFDKEFHETLEENIDNLNLFQIITACKNGFKYAVDSDGNKYNKYNRVFPVTDGIKGLYKFKITDDGKPRKIIFANLPSDIAIYNESVNDKVASDLPFNIDYNYYIDLAMNNYSEVMKRK